MTSSSRRIFAGLLVVLAALVAWFALRGPASSNAVDVDATKASSAAGFGGKRAIGGEVEAEVAALSRRPWNDMKATISGRVHDEAGKPIAGAMVCGSIPGEDTPVELRRTPKCTPAGTDGRYTLKDMPPIGTMISGSAATFRPARHRPAGRRRTIQPKPGETLANVDIELRSGGVEIKGVVKDIAGGVIEGARVTLGGWYDDGGIAITHADDEGAFALWSAPGDVEVAAEADGYTWGSKSGKAPGYTFEILLTPESVVGGRVIDAKTGAAVADARVKVDGEMWSSEVTYTDEGGRFRVDRLQPGRYTITATTADRHGVSNESRRVGLGETVEDIEVRVFPSASISGVVSIAGETPTPCESGSVSAVGRTTKHHGRQSSDRDGNVQVQGLPPDTYDIDVRCEGFVPNAKYEPVVLAEVPVTGLAWELDRGLSLGGVVVDARGAPVADATVSARQTGAAARAKLTHSWGSPTDAQGRFVIDGLLAGTYDVEASHREHVSAATPTSHTLVPGEKAELRLTLESGGIVRGRVVDAKQRPVVGAHVRLTSAHRDRSTASTGDDGTFELTNVRPGEKRLKATSGSGAMRAPGTSDDDLQGVMVDVRAGEVSEVELVVEEQFGAIAGTVVDADGGPVDDAFVSYVRESDSAKEAGNSARRSVRWSGWGNQAPVLTETGGAFELTQIPVGKHTLFAQRKGGGEGTIEHVETGTTGVVIRLTEGAALGGKVVIAGGGTPNRFTITASDETQGSGRSEFFLNTEGVWRISDLPPGKYIVAVAATEGAADKTVTLAPGESVEDVSLELTPRVDVSGTIVDLETGAPVANMMVTIAPLKGSGGFSFSSAGEQEHVSDESGKFTVRGAPSGAVRIMAMSSNFFGMPSGTSYGRLRIRGNIPADQKTHVLSPLRVIASRIAARERAGDLGFAVAEIPPEQQPEDVPLKVAVVRPGGPASTTELKVGDVIVEVDGQDVSGDNRYVYGALTQVKEGVSVTLGLAGGGKVTIVAGKPV